MPCSRIPSRQDQLLHWCPCLNAITIHASRARALSMQTQITSNTLTLLRHKCRVLAFPLDKTSFCIHIYRLNANTIHASRARALSMQTQITSNTLTLLRHICRVLAFPLDKTSFCIDVPVWMQTQSTHLALVPCKCRYESHYTLLRPCHGGQGQGPAHGRAGVSFIRQSCWNVNSDVDVWPSNPCRWNLLKPSNNFKVLPDL